MLFFATGFFVSTIALVLAAACCRVDQEAEEASEVPPEQYKRDFAYRTTAAGQVGVGANAPPSAWYIPIFPSFTAFRQCVCTTEL